MSKETGIFVGETGAVRKTEEGRHSFLSTEESQTYHFHRIATALERIADKLADWDSDDGLVVRDGRE